MASRKPPRRARIEPRNPRPPRQAPAAPPPSLPPVPAVAEPSPSAPPLFTDPQQIRAGLEAAFLARKKADKAERRAVVLAREEGMSWDVIGRHLEMSGETLRRRYAQYVSGA